MSALENARTQNMKVVTGFSKKQNKKVLKIKMNRKSSPNKYTCTVENQIVKISKCCKSEDHEQQFEQRDNSLIKIENNVGCRLSNMENRVNEVERRFAAFLGVVESERQYTSLKD
eukprot:NODE_145_length_15762_cov_0.655238.p8 type:complete len:115 gc:universal NODE_145_length_15762_cov_0.655238:15139-14795(-)